MGFIQSIEEYYKEEKERYNGDKLFKIFFPVCISVGAKTFNCFEGLHFFKSTDRTQFLYTKGDVRLYLSDADIIEMLLTVEDGHRRDLILLAFEGWLSKSIMEHCEIVINNESYVFNGIKHDCIEISYSCRKDINISECELFALINLILAKDVDATEIVNKEVDKDINLARRTIKKYIALLRWYWYGDRELGDELRRIGYKTYKSVYENFPPSTNGIWYGMNKKLNKKFDSIVIA